MTLYNWRLAGKLMSKSTTITFIEKCLSGDALYEDIDDYVDIWHDSNSTDELYEFLGMTRQEYWLWVRNPDILPQIVQAHKEKLDIHAILKAV